MPVNEILAPYYLRILYQTWAAQHTLTLYIGSGTLTASNGDYLHPSAQLPAINPDGSLAKMVQDVFDGFFHFRNVLPPSIVSIDLWQSAPGDNIFIDTVKPLQPQGGANQGIASSYIMLCGTAQSSTVSRQSWRITLFETSLSAAPQRQVVDWSQYASEFHYLYLYAKQNAIVSQDGATMSLRSQNAGYNRKLARRYGRLLIP